MDSDYLEKFKAQTEAISISLAKNQARRGTSSSVPTLPPASIASGSSNAPPVISSQPVAVAVDAEADAAPSKSITLTVRIFRFFIFCVVCSPLTHFNSVLARIRRATDHSPLTRRIPCAINVSCVSRSIK